MSIVLIFIPLLALIAGLTLYKHNGKREILRLDMVQFFYAFILLPVLYVWFKGFLFFVLESQLSVMVSQTGILVWDTAYSLLFLFLYAFVVIHSLTKSFKLKKEKDPLYDLFEHAEYYHLWVSHLIIYVGVMILFSLLSAINLWIDLPWSISPLQFYISLGVAFLMAGLGYSAFLKTDLDSGGNSFVRLMNLFSAVFFVLHIGAYIIFDPVFAGPKTMFWYQLALFSGLAFLGWLHEDEVIPLPLHKRVIRKFSRMVRKVFSRKRAR